MLIAEQHAVLSTGSHLIRRSAALIAFWDGKNFAIENYLTGKLTTVPVPVAALLSDFTDAIDYDLAAIKWGPLIQQLLKRDLLVWQDSELAEKDERLSKWSWSTDARYFHFSTQATKFECNDEVVWRALQERAATMPPPLPFKEVDGPFVQLPPPRSLSQQTLGNALLNRRTARGFRDDPIELSDLSDILWWTWGAEHIIKGEQIGDVLLKTSPSGGSRHPIEVYVSASNVRGVDAGIYHYSVRRHGLHLIKSGDNRVWMWEMCSRQEWVQNAPVAFLMTALAARTMWKYHQSHAYRVLLLDAGHLGQTFHLVCTSLGLGPFTTAALNCDEVDRCLQLDPIEEFAIYAGCAGYISPEEAALLNCYREPTLSKIREL